MHKTSLKLKREDLHPDQNKKEHETKKESARFKAIILFYFYYPKGLRIKIQSMMIGLGWQRMMEILFKQIANK